MKNQMNLESELERVIGQGEMISELNKDIKEARQDHPLFQEIEELKKEVKKKKDEMEADEAIVELKDQISTAKERKQLLTEMLVAKMNEEEVEEVSAKGKQAKMVKTVKIGKAKTV